MDRFAKSQLRMPCQVSGDKHDLDRKSLTGKSLRSSRNCLWRFEWRPLQWLNCGVQHAQDFVCGKRKNRQLGGKQAAGSIVGWEHCPLLENALFVQNLLRPTCCVQLGSAQSPQAKLHRYRKLRLSCQLIPIRRLRIQPLHLRRLHFQVQHSRRRP